MLISPGEQMSSSDFDDLLKLRPDFEPMGLSRNPFSIHPLFSDLNDDEACKRDEGLFFKSHESEEVAKDIGHGRRLLVYGDIGVGKTTLLNLALYLAKLREKFLPVRILVSEENVVRAVQEILYTVCMELIAQVKARKLTKPLETIQRWLLEKRRGDTLYGYLSRLIGPFEEETVTSKKTTRGLGGELGTGAVPGGKLTLGTDTEQTIENRFRSHVENLPAKIIETYLKDLTEIAEQIGYSGIVVGIDEADHIRDLSKVVGMLTVTRGLFFTSDKQFFVVAGSNELVKQSNVTEGIFDSLINLKALSFDDMNLMLQKRINQENARISLTALFDASALRIIHDVSRGFPKLALRMAENALTEAAIQRAKRVEKKHVAKVIEKIGSQASAILGVSETRVLSTLREIGKASPSSNSLQKKTDLSRQQLDRILRRLYENGLVLRSKKERAYFYETIT